MSFDTSIARSVASHAADKGTTYKAHVPRNWAMTARLAIAVVLVFVVSALAPLARADGGSATIWTDKDNYVPDNLGQGLPGEPANQARGHREDRLKPR